MTLARIRWCVRGVLLLGVFASIAGNVLHAQPDPIARTIAAVPPLAFFAVVEILSHVALPAVWYRKWASVVGLLLVGGVAAWLSYWHMVAVADRYGENSPHLMPLSVDGLIVVTGLALAELSRQIRAQREDTELDTKPAPVPVFQYTRPVGPEAASADNVSDSERTAGRRSLNQSRVEKALRRAPDATDGQIAARLGVSTKTVQRYRPPRTVPAQANGHMAEAGDGR